MAKRSGEDGPRTDDTRDGPPTRGYRGALPPPIPAPTWKRRLYIDRAPDLAALASSLKQAHVIALDAEFMQLSPHMRPPGGLSHRLALLQVAPDNDERASYVVDTLRLGDLSPLEAPLADPASLKLFHGVSADARMLATRGLEARRILDLEAVSRSIFGTRETSLQAMLQRACGIRMDKSLQRADWGRRPLTPAMVGYAARDAELTFTLYRWLSANYPWAVALHELPAGDPPPPVAPWILPYLAGSRPRPVELALAEAGLAGDLPTQERALREALRVVRHPAQRARVLRLITDLDLRRLTPDIRPLLSSPASEERAGAARALGRLRDRDACPLLEPLRDDPVEDVRQAASLALDTLSSRAPRVTPRIIPQPDAPVAESAVRWTSGPDEPPADANDWRARLLANFGASAQDEPDGEDD